MDKSFDPKTIESKWYAQWEAAGDFKPRGDGAPYCILLPPPNVTGTLHMGHAFQQTIMDSLTRYHRMRGFRTLWQGGTDHAGIATQKIVENQLAAQSKTRHDLGREKFIERVWDWKVESGSTITNQMRRLGASVDWSRERFTMDEGLSAAVRRVFVQWYRDGLIYRGRRLVNWDPVLMTAVSDLEVNNEERDGHMWHILYPFSDGPLGTMRGMHIATTRPETMLADGALAVHPDDERYKHLVGKYVDLPLCDRKISIIADDFVDPAFGSGCVKITGAHDFNDYACAKRHGIEMIVIMTLDAKMNENAPEKYRGLDRYAARKAVVADLEAQGYLEKIVSHKHQVPIGDRSGAVIEPMLTDQWFLDLTSDTRVDGKPGPGGKKAITEPALDVVRSGAVKFVPENWSTTYTQWLDNIQDWCVSRQLWWGHRIPAWYDEAGSIFVGEDEADARAHASVAPVGALRQDDDVLDTWFSSALWPFSTLGWPANGPVSEGGHVVADWAKDQQFLPSAVLVTGFDIIFFWVARMVMATTYFVGRKPDGSYEDKYKNLGDRVPFREVYINAIVRDAEGQKMSKSKGNTIDPLDLIDGIELDALVKKSTGSLLIPQVREKVEKRIRKDYPNGIAAVGTDALRFTFAALATHGRTINFDLKRAEGYKAFCNKLWNAARFVLTSLGAENITINNSTDFAGNATIRYWYAGSPTDAERWIVSRLARTAWSINGNFALYRFDLVAQSLYEFVWNDFCDWFIELSKPIISDGKASEKTNVRYTLLYVLEAILRALHPIVPFITEEIWQFVKPRLGLTETSITERPFPQEQDSLREDQRAANIQAELDIEWLRAVLTQVRRIRSEMNISPGKTIPLLFANGNASDRARAQKFAAQIAFLARSETPRWLDAGEAEPAAAAGIVSEMKVLIPLAGLIDLEAEKTRLDKEIKRQEGEIEKSNKKLANFGDKTPPAVVEQEKQRIAEFTTILAGLREQAARLSGA
jgi:valyl-tRNA synthetase